MSEYGGEGIQVLSVEQDSSGGRYRCSETALRRVTQVPGASGLPVAVVSVAGATRGGKSFLLDFFLRYLRASEEAKRNGSWLGADDEPLTGFSWRGGCERDTEGIHMWSEPIVVTVSEDSKEQVAVVLLDTQGSFDSTSTVRDSSTVFAVSTLLSSVQIYNLSQNIREDDLQYLQLFTEYGKLARERDEVTPFQELRFLVRDWSWAYQHALGAEGGQQLLDKRLEITSEQAAELRSVRSHIRSAFEHVRGFLLPHPGLAAAASPAFTGCIKDISAEFKEALLELVPSLFAPEHLLVKQINGERVTLQDFGDYFQTYVDIFNSDTLPTPTTVMQATSAASLEAAIKACRDEYTAHLQQLARGAACVPRAALLRHHAAATEAVRRAFAARRTFAEPALAEMRLKALLQELDQSLPDLVAANNGHIAETMARCKAVYETAMQMDCCLTSADLTDKHHTGLATSKHAFEDAFAVNMEDEQDSRSDETNENYTASDREDIERDWEILKKDLQELLPMHRERNVTRIEEAEAHAREVYSTLVQEGLSKAPCLHPHTINTLNRTAIITAGDNFRNAWLNDFVPEEQIEHLYTWINNKYEEFCNINKANNETKVQEAADLYQNIMTDICRHDTGRCLHPQELEAQHIKAQDTVLATFLEQRDSASRSRTGTADIYQKKLVKSLIPLYLKLEERNEELNKEAVKSGHEYYMSNIAPFRLGGEGVLELFGPPDMDVFSRHPRVKEWAVEHFLTKRRPGTLYTSDKHLDDLKKKIEDSFSWIVAKVLFNLAAQGLSVVAMGSMLLGRRA